MRKKGVNRRNTRGIGAIAVILLLIFLLTGCSGKEAEVFRSASDLDGHRIGVLSNSIQDDIVNAKVEDAQIAYYEENSGAILALKNRDIDAFSIERLSAMAVIQDQKDLAICPGAATGGQMLAFMLPKGDNVGPQINAIMAQMKADGTFQALYDKWMTGKDALIDYSAYDFRDRGNGVLRVAVNPLLLPLNFVGGDGDQLQGFEVELFYAIADRMNMGVVMSQANLGAIIPLVTERRVDVALSCTVITAERLESVDFSDPYYETEIILLCRAENILGAEGQAGEEKDFFARIGDSFERTFIRENRWKMIRDGFLVTLITSFFAVICGTALGFVLCWGLNAKRRLLSCILDKACALIAKIPNLVVLLIVYFVVFASVDMDPVLVAIVAFSLLFGIGFARILHTGIKTLDAGQSEAAQSLGIGRRELFFRILVPQAVRNILPLYKGEIVSLIKSTAVLGYIAIMDLTRAGDLIRSRTYEAFFPLITVAILYALLITAVIALVNALEKALLNKKRHRRLPKGVGEVELRPRRRGEKVQSDGEELIRVEHLTKVYSEATPVNDLSTTVHRGDVIAVIGPSGTGKSTLLRCINRLETPTSGDIYVFGQNVCDKNTDLRAIRSRMGMVFQSFNLFGHMTVLENIMFAPMRIRKLTAKAAYETAIQLLHSVGMADKALRYPDELSGGQKQRVAIARALAMDPDIILMDEPTSALDPSTVGEVQSVIRRLSDEGYTMLIVTHEMAFARQVSNRVFYMDEGIVFEDGTPEQIFDCPNKDKTRAFVQCLKRLDFTVTDKRFDCIAMLEQIRAFGEEHYISKKRIQYMEHCFEELCEINIVPAKAEDKPLYVSVEYAKKSDTVTMHFAWSGKPFDPMKEGDELSMMLLSKIIGEYDYQYTEGENRVMLTVKQV